MPKVIIVSGGSDGLGKEIARILAKNNQVIILAHNEEKIKAVSQELGSDYVAADVSKFDEVEKAIATVSKKYGRIDCLVNCAGIWAQGSITQNSPQEIEELLNVNTQGTIFLCKAVIPVMESQSRGEIINIISQDGLTAKKNRSLYHASKWAIAGFTKCLQQDVSEKNIKVSGIYPGLMKTTLFEKKGIKRDLSHALDLEEVARLVEFIINLKQDTLIPEIGIKHLLNNYSDMDDTNSGFDLNLDPNMITTQGGPQSITPATPPILSTPPTPGVIDITPTNSGFSDMGTPISAPVAPLPPLTTPPALPEEPVAISTEEVPVQPALEAPVTPISYPSEPAIQTQIAPTTPVTAPVIDKKTLPSNVGFSIDSTSPLFENPDNVKLGK